MRSYHTSRWLTWANPRIALRYSRTHAITSCARRSARIPTSRPAISTLAAIRLTSHSHGPGQRLVEIVRAEDQPAVRRGETAEVRDVSVAAGLHDDARVGCRRQVGGHHRGGASVERERRHEHPPVADRDQLLHARRGLRLEHRDRIRAVRDGGQVAVRRPRHLRAVRLGQVPPTRQTSEWKQPRSSRAQGYPRRPPGTTPTVVSEDLYRTRTAVGMPVRSQHPPSRMGRHRYPRLRPELAGPLRRPSTGGAGAVASAPQPPTSASNSGSPRRLARSSSSRAQLATSGLAPIAVLSAASAPIASPLHRFEAGEVVLKRRRVRDAPRAPRRGSRGHARGRYGSAGRRGTPTPTPRARTSAARRS